MKPAPGRVLRPMRRLAGSAAAMLDRLLPPACAVCRAGVPPGPPLCGVCESGLPLIPHPRCDRCGAPRTSPLDEDSCVHCDPWPDVLRRAASVVLHESPAPELVAGLKYRGWTALAPALAGYMVEPAVRLVSETGGARPVLLGVPLDRRRRRTRGFNQSSLLADGIAARTGWTRLERGLVRHGARRRQAGLGRAERMSNVVAAFAWDDGVAPRSEPVLLVDDVLTTGATAAACCAAVEAAGGHCLGVVTFARSLPRPGLAVC